MAAGDPVLRLNGSEGKMVLYSGKNPIAETAVQCESGEVAEKAQMFEDKILGFDRDQHDKRVRGYTFRMSLFMANTSVSDALDEREALRRARQPLPPLSLQFQLSLMDGTFAGFTLTGSVEAKWSISNGGSSERMKLSIDGMASEKTPAFA